jgi:hypothetical protein
MKEFDPIPEDVEENREPNIYDQYNNNNNDSIFQVNTEKVKRHRRGKNEINDRIFGCPDCDKCYLSGPALTTHRKTKHGFGNNGEKRTRGRPKKDCIIEKITNNNPQNKFIYFFTEDYRKVSNEVVDLEKIKNNLRTIFNQIHEELLPNINNVEEYHFYNLIIENWDKNEKLEKILQYNLDIIFLLYLKEFYEKVNLEYFWFMIKFIVLLREYLNNFKEGNVNKDEKNKLEYSQAFGAENVPEVFNDFLLEFMELYDYFGMDKEEIIEIILHFCFWLSAKQFTQLNISLLNNC